MKYIDADRLKAEIERRKELLENGTAHPEVMKWVEGVLKGYNSILDFIDSLQQEQPIGEEYAIEIGENTHTLRVGSQTDIDNLIRQEKQEQPHFADASKMEQPNKTLDWLMGEVKRYYSENYAYITSDQPTLSILTNIARHFFELGVDARKEKQI